MKVIGCILIAMAITIGCNKSTPNSYYGNWKLVKTSFTFLSNSGNIIPGGDSVVNLSLNINKRYSYSLNGNVERSGTFNIKQSDNTDELDLTQSIPNANEVTPQHIFFSNDTLVLTPLPNPAGATLYYYIKN